MNILAFIVALLFGVHADLDKANGDASVAVAYAHLHKPAPAREQLPSETACECDDKGGCDCKDACKCVGCKLDGSCCACASKTLPDVAKWRWFVTSDLTGEHRLMQGEVVKDIRKYRKVRVQSCNGRSCTVSTQWQLVK